MLRLVRALLEEDAELPPGSFQEGFSALRDYLSRRFAGQLGRGDIEDLAADAIAQFLAAARRDLVLADGNPTGYLLRIAMNNGFAMIRRVGGTAVLDGIEATLTDTDTAARFDRLATVDVLRRAMVRARLDGDVTAVKVATYLLDQIQQTGETPSNRTTGDALGLSHTGVAKALRRLRGYLATALTA
ncbi:DNA-directed RNA polymerase specialized sigma24 family protein [Couchioplanes caeruleus]|uniref:Uncharacterized protein n=3 Tax=Couchioplanes caeruleus TaxID=56438 RepID=A0A1K0GQX8_9ACTN|nr:hypothetical protein BG844_14485 [Couchioplanes caeruleus subsp. caeruleus]ROP30120.1 DNA-directed RNA polymerase specialized sigma24 family protein [Couchioplanes caeruleus]